MLPHSGPSFSIKRNSIRQYFNIIYIKKLNSVSWGSDLRTENAQGEKFQALVSKVAMASHQAPSTHDGWGWVFPGWVHSSSRTLGCSSLSAVLQPLSSFCCPPSCLPQYGILSQPAPSGGRRMGKESSCDHGSRFKKQTRGVGWGSKGRRPVNIRHRIFIESKETGQKQNLWRPPSFIHLTGLD